MQYTLRNVPPALDEALRRRARREGRSLNETTLRALARALGFDEGGCRWRALDDVRGTWQEDSEFDAALADQQSIDPDLWP